MTPPPLEYLEVEILGKPITWARTASGADGRRFTPERYAAWKAKASVLFAARSKLRSIGGEVAVAIDIHPDRVAVRLSALDAGDDRRPGTGLTGDVDNYAKAVLDALQTSGVLRDDIQVAELRVRIRPERSETADG